MHLESHWPLAFGLILVAAFGTWVFIHSNRSYLLRWAMIPVSLTVAVASAHVYDARLGYAMPIEQLPAKFVYIAHQVVIERSHKTGIEVWARTDGTRLYRIPYTKGMEKSMDEAREQGKGGSPVMMRERAKRPANEPQGSGKSGGDQPYESHVVLPSDMNPKSVAAS